MREQTLRQSLAGCRLHSWPRRGWGRRRSRRGGKLRTLTLSRLSSRSDISQRRRCVLTPAHPPLTTALSDVCVRAAARGLASAAASGVPAATLSRRACCVSCHCFRATLAAAASATLAADRGAIAPDATASCTLACSRRVCECRCPWPGLCCSLDRSRRHPQTASMWACVSRHCLRASLATAASAVLAADGGAVAADTATSCTVSRSAG